jgi:hypothetical protein
MSASERSGEYLFALSWPLKVIKTRPVAMIVCFLLTAAKMAAVVDAVLLSCALWRDSLGLTQIHTHHGH